MPESFSKSIIQASLWLAGLVTELCYRRQGSSPRWALSLVCAAALTAYFLIWGGNTLLGHGVGAASGCPTRVFLWKLGE